jgi:transposase
LLPLLLPDPGLCLDHVEITVQAVTLCLRTTAAAALCPLCAQPARQVHSRYLRSAQDLPIQGRPALLRLTARRFFCRTAHCPRRVFCEQFPVLLAKHAQATTRLHATHCDLGQALGGEPGSRLAAKLGMPTSADTLLRRVKQLQPNRVTPTPRVVGVDDWALRKGHTYGTIIIDLERSAVLELLPGRDGVALKTWLCQHPEVEVLSRDRWAAFAEAATEAAPQAWQVVDRFHLLKNVREALERFLDRYAGRLAEVFAEPSRPPAMPRVESAKGQEIAPPAPEVPSSEVGGDVLPETPATSAPSRPLSAKQQQRLERYQEVHRRLATGQSHCYIARALRLSRNTVSRYSRSKQCPDWRPGRPGPSQATPYRERVDAWLAAGCRNVAALHRQLQGENLTLGYEALRRFVSRRLAERGEWRGRLNAVQPPLSPPPSAKGLSFAVIVRPDERTEKQGTQVARLRESDVRVAEAVDLVEGFAALVRKQSGRTLTDWQEKARIGVSVELRRFAEGLGRDQAAVEAALQEPWSNGPVEGHVNRLKTIKRQMYGRAGLPLLRARVLHAG